MDQPEMSTDAWPSQVSSTRVRPTTEANLNPWAEPRAMAAPAWPGRRSMTNSRSGVRV